MSEEAKKEFLSPSPVMPRRVRTLSQREKLEKEPFVRGQIHSFCRQKGHGFITPDDGGEDIFMHVSDVESEYVPHVGDKVEYRTILIPPKHQKKEAVHVRIIHSTDSRHEKWSEPVSRS